VSGLAQGVHVDAGAAIGVFDSGVGGLTVLAALLARLPQERFVYLGDTARLPYGTKSADTVERYALQAAGLLVSRGIKALVIACNTASAVALPALCARHGALPLLGVVGPGAAAAVAASRSGRIAVIGTEATVRGEAYQRAIVERRPDAQIRAIACQLFVALAEEGWTEGDIARSTARRYLDPLLAREGGFEADTLVLGCTHFPLLRAVIREVVGEHVALVDSAAATAEAAHALLAARGLLCPQRRSVCAGDAESGACVQLLATDGVQRFATVGSRFLGRRIVAAEVQLVDL
jgi:glutamate racemase